MLERERVEREAQERLLYEREYIAKVEKQRKMQKDQQNFVRLEKEQRRCEFVSRLQFAVICSGGDGNDGQVENWIVSDHRCL